MADYLDAIAAVGETALSFGLTCLAAGVQCQAHPDTPGKLGFITRTVGL
ncbi:MAG: hypothetical protein F6K04_17985 [Leptolyngbya sp. SIO4C5]|nr:hypothetical protein [Leptolyngbya sp. SIO4C5]